MPLRLFYALIVYLSMSLLPSGDYGPGIPKFQCFISKFHFLRFPPSKFPADPLANSDSHDHGSTPACLFKSPVRSSGASGMAPGLGASNPEACRGRSRGVRLRRRTSGGLRLTHFSFGSRALCSEFVVLWALRACMPRCDPGSISTVPQCSTQARFQAPQLPTRRCAPRRGNRNGGSIECDRR